MQCFDYPNYFRIVLTVPDMQLREACNRIAQFCTAHYVASINKGQEKEEESLSTNHVHLDKLHNGLVTIIEP